MAHAPATVAISLFKSSLKNILEIKAHMDDHVCPSVIPTACLIELEIHCRNFEGI